MNDAKPLLELQVAGLCDSGNCYNWPMGSSAGPQALEKVHIGYNCSEVDSEVSGLALLGEQSHESCMKAAGPMELVTQKGERIAGHRESDQDFDSHVVKAEVQLWAFLRLKHLLGSHIEGDHSRLDVGLVLARAEEAMGSVQVAVIPISLSVRFLRRWALN